MILIFRYTKGAISYQDVLDMEWYNGTDGFMDWVETCQHWAKIEAGDTKPQQKTGGVDL